MSHSCPIASTIYYAHPVQLRFSFLSSFFFFFKLPNEKRWTTVLPYDGNYSRRVERRADYLSPRRPTNAVPPLLDRMSARKITSWTRLARAWRTFTSGNCCLTCAPFCLLADEVDVIGYTSNQSDTDDHSSVQSSSDSGVAMSTSRLTLSEMMDNL